MTLSLQLKDRRIWLFDDVTYLKLFVSKDEPWEAIINSLYGKKISKKNVKKRIAFVVVSADMGKVGQGKGDMWLQACDTFVQFQSGKDWEQEYEKIKQFDKEIALNRAELSKIQYLSPSLVPSDSQTNWSYRYLRDEWKLSEEEAAMEVSLYGASIIESFSKIFSPYGRHKEGRYHFVRALHRYALEQSKNLTVYKGGEASRLFYNE